MKVYIAGPMSGIPQFNVPAFDDAAMVLRKRGFEVVSPAEVDGPVSRALILASATGSHDDLPAEEPWSFYLARDFRILADDGIELIVTLPGWEKSRGARLEVMMGKELGIEQIELDSLIMLQDMKSYGSDTLKVRPPDEVLYDSGGHFIAHADNPERQRAVTGAVKDNRSKSRVDLIPAAPLLGAGVVLGYGAHKYKPNNWRLGLGWSDTWASLQRHLLAFNEGEDIDKESGLPHIDHAMCQLLFLSNYYHTSTGVDDRWASSDKEEAKA